MDYILRKFKYKQKPVQSSAPDLVVTSPQSMATDSNSSKFEFELEERLSLHSFHSSPDKHRVRRHTAGHSSDTQLANGVHRVGGESGAAASSGHRRQSHQYSSHYSLNSSPSHSSASSDGPELRLNAAVHKILMGRPVIVRRHYYDDDIQIGDNSFAVDCQYWHNFFRAKHGSPPLSVSYRLVNMAQEWANYLAHTDSYKYRNSEGIGENLMCKWTCHPDFDPPGEEIVRFWYSEMESYNFNIDPAIMHTLANHFTQIVWKSTVEFGIGKAHTRGGKLIVVANYRPSGNIIGGFQDNVLPRIKDDSHHKKSKTNTTSRTSGVDDNAAEDMDSLNEASIQTQSLLSST
ncbi:unnamed protein product [Medioppia subpectinata]|uniref:SCP domain-containing protein n=1 Tax=Medioppia subpectinata TaxID=1979941 RepID=A0A7R9PU09_9ACAR|nr:unnamed protein product [Medioppia subpectinata]CAG2100283.1 unnamed protein product [Medioppia subpectinata]